MADTRAPRRSVVLADSTGEISTPPLRVLALGDSTVTGQGLGPVGGDSAGLSPDMWLAKALAAIAQSPGGAAIELVVRARNGNRLADVHDELAAVGDEAPDIVVVALGTNDLTRPSRWRVLPGYRSRYRHLLQAIARQGPLVVATGVGDLSLSPRLTARPHLLALKPVVKLLSWYLNRQIEKAINDLDARPGAITIIQPREIDAKMVEGKHWYFSTDCFHPNARGHEVWAEQAMPTLRSVVGLALARAPAPTDLWAGLIWTGLIWTGMGYAWIRTAEPASEAGCIDRTKPEKTVVLIPDAPNTLDHYDEVFLQLTAAGYRVLGLEMPGLGRSVASRRFDYSLRAGADWISSVLDHQRVDRAVVATAGINGLWAAEAATIDGRIEGLVLAQTLDLETIRDWGRANIRWPLRLPLIGDLILWAQQDQAARIWYNRALGDLTKSPHFLRLARRGFATGARWKLAQLYTAIQREARDPLEQLDLPVSRMWGLADGSYQGDGPSIPHGGDRRLDNVGHFPDLEAVTEFRQQLEAVFRQVEERKARPGEDVA